MEKKMCVRCGVKKPLSKFVSISGKRHDLKLCIDCRTRHNELCLGAEKQKIDHVGKNISCGKIGIKEYKRRMRNKITCCDSCARYKSKEYPCSRYPAKFEVQYSRVELALTCIDFKQK